MLQAFVITLREGRNRQVRNMCEAIGHPVDHLKRVAIGPLRDARLKVGYWRDLSAEEVARLQKAAGPVPTGAPLARDRDKDTTGNKGHRGKPRASTSAAKPAKS